MRLTIKLLKKQSAISGSDLHTIEKKIKKVWIYEAIINPYCIVVVVVVIIAGQEMVH